MEHIDVHDLSEDEARFIAAFVDFLRHRRREEAFIMGELREHRISEAEAADILGLTRYDLLEMMGKYRVPAIDMTEEELIRELNTPFPRPNVR